MKYIILPILKFIWALLLTITFASLYNIICLLGIVWNLKIEKDQFTYQYRDDHDMEYSPYYNHKSTYYFKTVYHYIWNIK